MNELSYEKQIQYESEKKVGLDVIKNVYGEEIKTIVDLHNSLQDASILQGRPYNPVARFRTFIESRFKTLKIEGKPEDFVAHSYAVGLEPYEKQLSFDTEDGVIFESYKKFAEETLKDLK